MEAAPLVVEFSVGKSVYDKLETESVPSDEINAAINCLIRAGQLIRDTGVFSPNETIEDTNTSDLKYLLVPYYLAFLHLAIRDMDSRLLHVETAISMLNAFLGECYRRGAMSDEDRAAYERESDNPSANRTDKVRRFKREKALNEAMQVMIAEQVAHPEATEHSEEVEREYVLALLEIAIGKSMSELATLNQEKEILHHMRQNRPAAVVAQPQPEDDTRFEQKPIADTSTTAVTSGLTGGAWDLRQKLHAKVFTYGLSLPTMTLEEFAEVELKNALERSERQKEKQAEKAKIDPDSEEAVDAETLKKRGWDDYKDENPRGVGNTGLKSMYEVVSFMQENPNYKL
eukprot:c53712_g1_i1.p1 GENE.c53712_g1_i1~~c53712_g1_i1.p1  ORF type:complete len:356 (+),score=68.82 c53712_g1_i1:38-1069(+)